MANSINSGDSCEITRDIMVSGQVAFKDGEHVVVEGISPSPQMPEFKYVVYSRVMQQRFQLSENDIKVSDDPPREEAGVTQSHEIKKVKYCATCGNVLNENGECRSCSRAHSVTLSSTSPRSPKPTSIRAAYNPYAIGIGVTELIVGSGFALLTIIAFSYIGFDYHSPPAYLLLVVYLGYSIAMILSGIAACKRPVERQSLHFVLGAATVFIFILDLLLGGADAGGGRMVLYTFMFLIGGVVILALTFMIRAKLLSPEASFSHTQSAGDSRTCPYCAETIKAAAIKCRFCGAELSKNNTSR